MFDFGLSELLLVGVVALIVLGPERLPAVARTAGRLVGKMQRLVANVKQELSAQVELDELRKAKQEFEAAATQFKNEIKDVGSEAQNNLNQISDGLKPWERLPEQRTPADFGVDAQGNPLPQGEMPSDTLLDENGQPVAPPAAETAEDSESAQNKAWRDYLTAASMPSESPQVEYLETAPSVGLLHTASLRKQAMQRKRDMRPKFQAKPKLRVRKK
ncbi:Sec-independent protein translocase protein TatB [Neisseria chenwenguii]|uniref:Sec-independent protein translocase protein TatB n=1 Tax=Neisseria chenwenguii TaxID=1853278 RepID=A0A220S3G5_9NEIS|nr:Sec-independent protein translocase protein TatB [Neisseria chenwenguii]ASK27745.1 twin-arginine translocase subunit TatB [Neisseria chenwenguii]ROV56485.1 twin-arginine translocase subunit TatB [Neisseria chenwenguii]